MARGSSEGLVQTIKAGSVDQRELIRILQDTYGESEGKSNFRIELRLNQYKIYADNSTGPRPLTKDQMSRLVVCRRK